MQIISGFHSPMEKQVLHYLLKNVHPIILVLAKGMKKQFEPEIKHAIEQKQILVITPFEKDVKEITENTVEIRNNMVVGLANDIVVGYVTPNGKIDKLLGKTTKPITKVQPTYDNLYQWLID